jgi:DUF4097 and DUF4098 domain-containing protein YvlB
LIQRGNFTLKIQTVIALGLLSISAANADQWNKHWNVSGKPELHVSAGDASVVVESGGNGGIDANLTTQGWNIGDSGVRVTEHQTGNRVDIDVKAPTGTHFNFGNHSIKLEVRVPRELLADIHTGDGSIRLLDLHGSVRADTGDGSIQADRLDGIFDAHSGDGSVHISGRFDNLRLHTQDGSVGVEVLEGSKLSADWRVETGDGSVSLRLPKTLSANLEMHTGDGHIRLDVPLTVTTGQNEHRIEGKLNGGGPLFMVKTGDGSISVGSL